MGFVNINIPPKNKVILHIIHFETMWRRTIVNPLFTFTRKLFQHLSQWNYFKNKTLLYKYHQHHHHKIIIIAHFTALSSLFLSSWTEGGGRLCNNETRKVWIMKEMLCKTTLRTNFFFTLTYIPIHAHIYMRKVLKRKLIDRSDNYSTFILKEFHDEMFKSVCVRVYSKF